MIPRTRLGRIVGIVVVLAVAAAGYAWYQARERDAGPRYRTVRVERGPLQAVVEASGTLNAVSTVQVASRISGQVKEIYADFNTPVKAGAVLARIDPSGYELRLNQARADLDAANSAVALARSQLEAQRAEAQRRKSRLLAAQIRVGRARVASALAAVEQRQALLQQAQADLERTTILAPVDGTVILRNVDAGQTVTASAQAPALFVIAQDLHDMQVEAAVDQADIGRLKVGQHASFTVDAFPRRSFSGELKQIRKSPRNVQSAVRYTVLISAPNADLALLPGMTANVRVVVAQRDDALKLPNAALRFSPAGAAPPRRSVSSGRVWVLNRGELSSMELRLGLNDGASTEVLSGALKANDEVVVGPVQTGHE
ncbi:MAG: efflux RND transporter periplasmic adaptor subunit [Burkholderiales bacterium]